jgi:hypothetical protein
MGRRIPLEERFWAKVERQGEDECWPWRGKISGGGYGYIRANGKDKLAHRVVYEFVVGAIPAGHSLHHICQTTNCVNPAHLRPLLQFDHSRAHMSETCPKCGANDWAYPPSQVRACKPCGLRRRRERYRTDAAYRERTKLRAAAQRERQRG